MILGLAYGLFTCWLMHLMATRWETYALWQQGTAILSCSINLLIAAAALIAAERRQHP
jgi:hypothetical protein